MKKAITFIVTIVFTFYMAVIYNSNTVLFLAFVEIFLGSVLLLWNLWNVFHLEVEMKVPIGIAEKKKKIPVCITVINRSILPAGEVKLCLREQYALTGQRGKSRVTVSVEGRKRGEKSGKTELHMMWEPEHVGMVTLAIRRGFCCDPLKIFRLPIGKKRCRTEEIITILPERYAVPLEIVAKERQGGYMEPDVLSNGRYNDDRDSFQIREYRAGDPMRDIHWKLSAKENTWMIREYEPRLEDVVTFMIDLSDTDIAQAGEKNRRRLRKKTAWNQEAVLSVVLSIVESLYHAKCECCVVWYNHQENRVRQCYITQEEDIYALPEKLGCLSYLTGEYDLQIEYEQVNCGRQAGRRLILDRVLQLRSDDGQNIVYSADNLEETLTSQILWL